MKKSELPPLDCERVTDYIAQRMKWYVFEYAQAKGGVLGLSGGIDSAVTAYLSVRALGRENLHFLILPAAATKESDIGDAMRVLKALEINGGNFERMDISPIVAKFKDALGPMGRVEEGNITARIRMTILHQRAAAKKALVIGTGDKSEITIGYFTKFGDGGVDFLPIGGLYKTYVRELARYISVPESIVTKPSSPSLWADQTAERELGIDYSLLDLILYLRFEQWLDEGEVARRASVSLETVERIMRMVKSTQHKRLPSETFKIGFRDHGSDWRYPRQWA